MRSSLRRLDEHLPHTPSTAANRGGGPDRLSRTASPISLARRDVGDARCRDGRQRASRGADSGYSSNHSPPSTRAIAIAGSHDLRLKTLLSSPPGTAGFRDEQFVLAGNGSRPAGEGGQ